MGVIFFFRKQRGTIYVRKASENHLPDFNKMLSPFSLFVADQYSSTDVQIQTDIQWNLTRNDCGLQIRKILVIVLNLSTFLFKVITCNTVLINNLQGSFRLATKICSLCLTDIFSTLWSDPEQRSVEVRADKSIARGFSAVLKCIFLLMCKSLHDSTRVCCFTIIGCLAR